ncbi:MAG TPA: NAD(P)/FAD-dependent oxidoreductase [Candidatus Limnocylindrales bacterium]|nr:NAD(P)/FAD-dependent oxidoreductase [Candidatus Limnocylindrales bacterium]
MDTYDFIVIGAGAAGEAAAQSALARGRSVAVVERDLAGGSCPFWACMPSKTLLHAAAAHASGAGAAGDAYPWARASARRDYMIVREGTDYPDDGGHVHALEEAGGTVIRGTARLDGPGRVLVAQANRVTRELSGGDIMLAVGSTSKTPPIDGLEGCHPWTNREATSTRELPASLIVLGGGPTGVEMAQVFARYGVPVTIVEHNERLLARDHPRNAEAVRSGLERDGVVVRTGIRAVRARAGAGTGGRHAIDLDDGTQIEGQRILLAIGRSFPLDDLGLDTVGIERQELRPDGRLRLRDHVWLIGDPAGPELHTHVSHYQGEMAVRMALGEPVKPDYRAIPRCTYTDPEAAFVGRTVEQARADGIDAVEFVESVPQSAKGYVSETEFGHVTIVVDRAARTLVGAAICGPVGSSEAIHEAVLAIKAELSIDLLADTIHAFPTTARVLGTAFIRASQELG